MPISDRETLEGLTQFGVATIYPLSIYLSMVYGVASLIQTQGSFRRSLINGFWRDRPRVMVRAQEES